jgi:hypothetical protein
MALNMRASVDQIDPYQECAMQRQQVHVGASATSSQSPSAFDLPSGDCTYGKPPQHSPSDARHHGCVESHGRSMLQVRCSKRTYRHRVQRPHDAIMESRGDMGSSQILLIGLLLGEPSLHLSNAR